MIEDNCLVNLETGKAWRDEIRNRVINAGYAMLYIPNHPNANKKGYVRENRFIMTEKIGRYLLPSEDVHHKDRNTLNNDPDNLELLIKAEHNKLHGQEWAMKAWKTAIHIRERPKNPNMARKRKKTIIITTRRTK